MTDVDVIVLDIDGGAMLRECLASVDRQTLPPNKIIVFDNGSRTPTPGATARSEKNLGFAGGVNAALAYATSPFVALINNDVILDDDWLATVRDAIDPSPPAPLPAARDEGRHSRETPLPASGERVAVGRVMGIAAVQTIIRRDANTIDGAGIDISDGTIRQFGRGLPLGGGQAPTPVRTGEAPVLHPWGVSATAALYRRELLHFDERFFAYYEDVELCARLHEQGWRTRVLPEVKATHRGSQSAERVDAKYFRTRNRYFVARLHRGVGRKSALLWEDMGLLVRGRSSLRGIIEGMFGRMKAEG
jgi:N-acetylglucosaminyl-diphospho-decaprenol L-rhamnosyltransferase